MARDLKLQVLLNAVDKATGPLKKITQGSDKTAQALKASRDQLRNLERQQKDLSSFRKLKDVTRDNSEALARAQERMRNLRTELKNTAAPTQQFQQKFLKAQHEVERLNSTLGDQRRRLGQLRTSLKQGGVSTDDLSGSEKRLAGQIRQANTALDAQKRKMADVTAAQKKAAAAADRYQRGLGRANTMRSAGFTGLATGGSALYAGARLLAPGIEYGETMSKVQALTRLDKDDPRLEALKQQSRDLGSSTAFSASEVGQGQSFLAMAGFTPEAIQKAIPDMLNLALANGMDLGRTADISSNILSGFGLDPDQMGRVGDVLTATTTRANVDLEMLGDTMKYVAPQARAMGMSLEQASAMAALLGNVGIQASQAGTTMRAMITRLAAPTGEAAGALKELGLQAKDSNGDLRAVPKILADVYQATKDMGNADRTEYLKTIFGEEPGAGMAELINKQGAAGIEQFVDVLEQSGGESARVAKTMADNIGGDLKSLRSAWEEVGISITDTNEGPLRDLVQWITDVTRSVGNWIKENPKLAGTIAKVAAVTAGLVAAGGAFTIMMASLLGPIVTVRLGLNMLGIKAGGLGGKIYSLTSRILPALGKGLLAISRGFLITASAIGKAGLALLTNPMTWIILGIVAAVAALAGAAYLVYKNWGAISEWFSQRWQDVKAAFDGGIAGISRLILDWSPLGLLQRGITSALSALGIEVPDQFKSLGGTIIDGLIGGLFGKLGELKNSVVGIADSVTGWFKDKLDIHSPSRVFAALGGHTVDGLTLGLERQRDDPAKSITDIASRVRQAGAGLALGAMALPAAAIPSISPSEPIRFDSRPPLAAGGGQQMVDQRITLGDINITASPGMDERQLAQYVAQEVQRALAQAQRDQGARRRSSMYDQE
ncbi:phage tail tape measure protein [Kushneria indalinina]|uniref:TP901 family phage tail tape measure protein n=1 Tax=Kushneria indalinina DSM 14324 TaxID=1122140 RepID=A0A3D9DVV1_9GAMM|nr:phage tail tape measure protein [Kushneria indalinina]REC94892.1 TP901 family phage tail tape measure protein [Kushneria indalinina DSM 14324]